ncbi:AP-5 complex subunit sigma-1-like [Gigantopelta aegis]|uniref:AP-5 complex subunit sigma-1-like n=1 Tax=Gigantopelta aegis TaxID=1735272 RepID=UPI001B88CEBE|nr:AP-5 complex subunit sigma-1-like [Gigantopelta aegis]
MVFAFLINTLLPGSSKVLFYQFYGQRALPKDDSDITFEEIRTGRKNEIHTIANEVHSEYQFRRSVSNRTVEEDVQRLNSDDMLPDFDTGHFLIHEGHNFPKGSFVTWMGAGFTGFALVCDKTESRLTAESVLRLLVRYLQEYVRVLNQPAETGIRSDRILLVLNKFLPSGSLLVMNHRVIRHLEKELDSFMKNI